MSKPLPFLKANIRNQFVGMLVALLIIFSIILIMSYLYVKVESEQIKSEREEISEKVELIDKMDRNFNGIFFRARGYYAFKNDEELQFLYGELESFEKNLVEYEKLPLSTEELLLLGELKNFIENYKNVVLPEAISYIKQDNYDALRNLSNAGTNASVNNFIAYTEKYSQESEQQYNELIKKTTDLVKLLIALFILIGLVTFISISIIMRLVLINIIAPIEKLKGATDALATGHYMDVTTIKEKEDEIGLLANSFYNLTLSIQDKEEELTTQNEELLAQQDELTINQTQLQQSLNQLKKYNELNNLLTLTLNKMQLLQNLHKYLRERFQFDSSILYLMDSKEVVTNGLSEKSAKLIIEQIESDKLIRLEEDKSFVIKREVPVNDQNIARDPYYSYDLYTSILNSESKLVAVMMATREGHAYSNQEISDMNGLLNQASGAIERIFMYEEMERSRKLNQNIIDTVNEGIQFVSKLGEVVLLNKALFGIIDFPDYREYKNVPQQIWLKYFQSITDQSDELIYFLKNAIIEDFSNTRTMRYSITNDLTTFVEVYATSVYEGDEKIGTMFVHRDITSEYEIDQMKSDLVSTVSHELRTPLSSVLGFTELLLTKEVKPERQKKYIETIHKEAKRLTNLINDFLDLQRMESGKQTYSMGKLALVEVTEEIVNNFVLNNDHQIRLINNSTNDEVHGDQERLIQLYINLIGNAIKFSPNGGEITITIENHTNLIQVAIQDQGLGIPEQEIERLFQKFKRVDNSSRRKIGGTGLGLALCKEIITKHNGDIWIESTEGVGTTVYFTLPLASQHELKKISDNVLIEQKYVSNRNIMIVEDDLSLALLLSEELKSKGFAIFYHDNPMRAFEEAIQIPLLGIVIDLMLSDSIKGWDFVEMLRNDSRTKDIPIIISSALDESKENVEKYKIEKYFTKPYPPEKLSQEFQRLYKNL